MKALQKWLWAAAIYNVIFGAYAVIWPAHYFAWAGLPAPQPVELWQCIGMIVGVYGLGYAIAARDPNRHWPIVLVGLLGKVFGPLGFLMALWKGTLPWSFAWILLSNDLLWWPSFFLLMRQAAQFHGFDWRDWRKF
jgi:hypothetical protein